MESKNTGSDTHRELYHWFRTSVLRCGPPTRIVYIGAAIITVIAFIDSDTAARLLGLGVIVFILYVILNCFFNVDNWLFKKELEYDLPEYYGPEGKLKKP